MGSVAQARANGEAAKRMKEMGIIRRTGACPMGCGRQIALGGQALIFHLGRCEGKRANR